MQYIIGLSILSTVCSQNVFNFGICYLGFLQLSNDSSGEHNEGMEDQTKILTVFLLNIIGCVFCCVGVQVIIIISKKMNAELINLKRNYTNFLEFQKLNELRKNYNDEKIPFRKDSGENDWLLNEHKLRMDADSDNVSEQISL